MFKVLVHQDETVRLKKQEQRQRQSTRERIQGGKPASESYVCTESFFFSLNLFQCMTDTEKGNIMKQSCLWEGLENELEDVRGQIREKTLLLLDSSDIMITDRCKHPTL